MSAAQILIVEDNVLVGMAVKDTLSGEGYEVSVATDGKSAEELLEEKMFSVCILDLMLPDTDGQTLLKKWQSECPGMNIIIATAYGDIVKAVECIKAGAYDFLVKPVEKVLLKKTVARAVEQMNLSRKVDVMARQSMLDAQGKSGGLTGIIGSATNMKQTVELAQMVAVSDFSCLFIRGESGTGKGLFAKTIHEVGRRKDKPFVEVNCSALPATLIESELFGHKKGAFTDAKEDKVGLFELANEGTLFLDEIGDMDINLQTKLLKVIEDQRFRRIGDTKDISVDVAIIAATHQSVEKLVEDGSFRQDLYYRLNVVPLNLPPLREHPEDIGALCEYFIKIYTKKFNKNIKGFTDDAMRMLLAYEWPGNVRELRNVVERGCLLSFEDYISNDKLLFPFSSSAPSTPLPPSTAETVVTPVPSINSVMAPEEPLSLADAEKRAIEKAMEKAEGNKNHAARILGVHRTTLYKKLAEYGLDE